MATSGDQKLAVDILVGTTCQTRPLLPRVGRSAAVSVCVACIDARRLPPVPFKPGQFAAAPLS
jgi:hypothetical protein